MDATPLKVSSLIRCYICDAIIDKQRLAKFEKTQLHEVNEYLSYKMVAAIQRYDSDENYANQRISIHENKQICFNTFEAFSNFSGSINLQSIKLNKG